MINTVKDGGTAFPLPASEYGGNGPEWGMSLRDYFAAKAMPVILADPRNLGYVEAAECSYDMADAMLSAREKQKPEEPLVPPPSYCKPSCPEIHREYGTSQAQKNGGPYICRKCGLDMPF